MNDTEPKLEQFIRVKDVCKVLAISKSTFYRKTAELRGQGFPQVYNQLGTAVCLLREVADWQEKVKQGQAIC